MTEAPSHREHHPDDEVWTVDIFLGIRVLTFIVFDLTSLAS